MTKYRTIPLRSDPEFKKMVDEILKHKPRKVKSSRVTLAILNQYKKYPNLFKELKEAKLD